jgi:hypothetical protein
MARVSFQGMLKHQVPEGIWQRLKEVVSAKNQEAGRLLEEYSGSVEGIRTLEIGAPSEKEFEDQVVLPLLGRLGWTGSGNLRRQHEMDIKIGSGRPRRVRADLVGFRDTVGAEVLFVIECKRRIRSEEELRSAVEQCESYAGKLRCARFAVAAPEGFWIYDLRFPVESELLKRLPVDDIAAEANIDEIRPLLGFSELLAAAPSSEKGLATAQRPGSGPS